MLDGVALSAWNTHMKEQVHEIDSKAYIIMSEVADIFSNNMDKA